MDDDVDLTEVIKLTNDKKPDFILLFHSYGFPDHYFICLSDPNQENPTIFGTDHEVYFREITHEVNLEDFFNNFMTKDELFELIKKRIQTL
ncbi:hypothetical protein [Chryseobacterium sp.]|uniref:hypothetical protein n=1 Tax=Chryseobacterium sp. TaxID=1871047 RepID=UPI0025C0B99B|nr:hypothetical protein [Chryseobacterium sp.]